MTFTVYIMPWIPKLQYYTTCNLGIPTPVIKMENSAKRPVEGKNLPPKKRRKRSPQVRYWLFTDYGEAGQYYPGRLVPDPWGELPAGVDYLTWQLERGEKSKKLHRQGYIELTNRHYVSWLHKNISKTASFFVRRGTGRQAKGYTNKEETRELGPWSLGQQHGGQQGLRTDLVEFKDAIKGGMSTRDLAENHLLCLAKYPRLHETLRNMYRPAYDEEGEGVKVALLFGSPGIGKTRQAYSEWGQDDEFYETPITTTGAWWDGYDKHKYVLMDDFNGASSHMRLDTLLKVLDRYPRRVPYKGGHTWYCPERIMVTTNIHPSQWYDWSRRVVHYEALIRRFSMVILWDGDGEMYTADEDWWKLEEVRVVNEFHVNGGCCHPKNYCNLKEHKQK